MPTAARKEPRTEASPAGPCPATIRRPAGFPVCGGRCGRRACVLAPMANARGVTRPQTLWKANLLRQAEEARNPIRTASSHLGGDESERRHNDRASAMGRTAQAEAIPCILRLAPCEQENGLGFHHHHLRNQGCPPTSGRRPREYDDLTATTPFQMHFLWTQGPNESGTTTPNEGPRTSQSRAAAGAKDRSTPSAPFPRQTGGEHRGIGHTHARHKHLDSKKGTTPKMEIKYPCAAKLEARREEEQTHTENSPPRWRVPPRQSAPCAQKGAHASIHYRHTVADFTMAECQAAEKAQPTRRRRPDAITIGGILPSNMRFSVLKP
ncbi:hypothetical protein Tc00.1047053511281.53 [Trypanosoma cruzi]|uniref:Uncharacterized protein n=1 Tax=Trypanosoma cruzi (strain CL Brener) TaxID=353153 RepID=Q4D9Z7_TRYCC|nr:hypothetical protein Tc00.1047053511281.53 [Trypanosoma cruzi]EAN89352.1 hypothetical protein Tc00.1047053511281.53 [Trypanosoma cruzi]|eukprot:XP_811203.1 hypothetical protein [Trypanosoma cruzi strain CL Brener]